MSFLPRIILAISLAGAALMSAPAYADLIEEKFLGVARYSNIMGLNFEFAGDKGGAWALIGAHRATGGLQIEDDMTAVFGYRRYFDGNYGASNWFGGIVAGDVYPNGSGPRYGIGAELGYQWMHKHVRTTFSGGVAMLEEIKEGTEGKNEEERAPREVEPRLLFGFSANLRR